MTVTIWLCTYVRKYDPGVYVRVEFNGLVFAFIHVASYCAINVQ